MLSVDEGIAASNPVHPVDYDLTRWWRSVSDQLSNKFCTPSDILNVNDALAALAVAKEWNGGSRVKRGSVNECAAVRTAVERNLAA